MSDEVHIDYESGNTIYFIIRNGSGQVWYPTGEVFENWNGGAGRDMDDYDIALVDKLGNRYVGSVDSNLPDGDYSIQAFLQLGANPDDGDSCIGGAPLWWVDGSELTEADFALNTAIPGSPNGDSINERIKTMDDSLPDAQKG